MFLVCCGFYVFIVQGRASRGGGGLAERRAAVGGAQRTGAPKATFSGACLLRASERPAVLKDRFCFIFNENMFVLWCSFLKILPFFLSTREAGGGFVQRQDKLRFFAATPACLSRSIDPCYSKLLDIPSRMPVPWPCHAMPCHVRVRGCDDICTESPLSSRVLSLDAFQRQSCTLAEFLSALTRAVNKELGDRRRLERHR